MSSTTRKRASGASVSPQPMIAQNSPVDASRAWARPAASSAGSGAGTHLEASAAAQGPQGRDDVGKGRPPVADAPLPGRIGLAPQRVERRPDPGLVGIPERCQQADPATRPGLQRHTAHRLQLSRRRARENLGPGPGADDVPHSARIRRRPPLREVPSQPQRGLEGAVQAAGGEIQASHEPPGARLLHRRHVALRELPLAAFDRQGGEAVGEPTREVLDLGVAARERCPRAPEPVLLGL